MRTATRTKMMMRLPIEIEAQSFGIVVAGFVGESIPISISERYDEIN
jgi:hypothetical protein